MTNQWNPNQPPPYPQAAPGGYPSQQPTQYGGPQPQYQQPPQQYPQGQYGAANAGQYGAAPQIGSIQDLQGLNEAIPDSRFPELPPGVTALMRLEAFKIKPTAFGLKQFTEGTIVQCTRPELVGGIYTTKIGGFNNIKAKKYALQDLKALLFAIFHTKGLTLQTPNVDWIALADQCSKNNAPIVGTLFSVQSQWREPKQAGQNGMMLYTYSCHTA